MKILVIEDNEDDRILLEVNLSRSNLGAIEYRHAETLREGLSLAVITRFDLVLLDLGLPDSSGIDTFLRFQKGAPEQAVLVLTGSMDEHDTIAAIQAGAQDCLVKGTVGGHALARAIRHASERQRILDRARMHASALEAAANGIIITDPEGKITFVNPAFSQLLDRDADELMGKTARTFKSNEHDGAIYQELWKTISSGRVWHGRIVNQKPDGTKVPTQLTITPVLNDDGRTLYFIGIYEDLTDREKLENSLRQGEKMRAIGQLAGGVAHDFNNLLTVLVGHGEIAYAKLQPNDGSRPHIVAMLNACDRANRLTSQLLAFGRRQMVNPKRVRLNEVILGMRDMIERLIGEDVRIEVSLSDELWHSHIDVHLIEQVILNLSTNARDAMPNGGTLSYRTKNCSIDEEYARLHHPMQEGDFVELTVSDTGSGMAKEILTQVFEPFFTTKPLGKGTGLGLASVYGTVKQSGGFIWAYSEPGEGTSFKIYFPRHTSGESSSARRRVTRPQAMPSGSNQRVLLVEDNDAVRDIIKETLATGNYQVKIAESGDDAMQYLGSGNPPFDLLISDLVMPGIPVSTLIEKLRAENPKMEVLILSGYPHEMVERKGVDLRSCQFLEKPFKPSELLTMIESIFQ